MLFCNGTDDEPTSVQVVCDNLSLIPHTIVQATSMSAFCAAKPHELCNDAFFNKTICQDNEIMLEKGALCKLYPDKCQLGTTTLDWCAFNAYECLLDQTWDFCASFPDLCVTKPTYHYAKIEDLGKAICDSDHATFC